MRKAFLEHGEGKPFGEKYFYKWWKRACSNLGIEGVDLYGGTKHSTVTALENEGWLYDEIKTASGISTNEAFDSIFAQAERRQGTFIVTQFPARELGNNWETISMVQNDITYCYLISNWWRRRESNPRPKIFHCSFYILVLCFNLTLNNSRRQDLSRAIPLGFRPFHLGKMKSAILPL